MYSNVTQLDAIAAGTWTTATPPATSTSAKSPPAGTPACRRPAPGRRRPRRRTHPTPQHRRPVRSQLLNPHTQPGSMRDAPLTSHPDLPQASSPTPPSPATSAACCATAGRTGQQPLRQQLPPASRRPGGWCSTLTPTHSGLWRSERLVPCVQLNTLGF